RSFPTRRSSDLDETAFELQGGVVVAVEGERGQGQRKQGCRYANRSSQPPPAPAPLAAVAARELEARPQQNPGECRQCGRADDEGEPAQAVAINLLGLGFGQCDREADGNRNCQQPGQVPAQAAPGRMPPAKVRLSDSALAA